MAKKKKETPQFAEEPETAYFTKRALERALRKATKNLTQEAMDLMGYVVTVEDGWVVKKFKDGTRERMSQLEKIKRPKVIVLD